jgi:hypothetical protein
MFRVLKALGIPENHPSVGIVGVYRAGLSNVAIKPDSSRWRNLAFVLGKMSMVPDLVTADHVRAWLVPILEATKTGNMTEAELKGRIKSIVFALEGVPKFLLSADIQRDLIRKAEWFPTAAEIWPFIEPALGEYRALRADLNILMGRDYSAPLPAPEEVLAEGWLVETEKVARLIPITGPLTA